MVRITTTLTIRCWALLTLSFSKTTMSGISTL